MIITKKYEISKNGIKQLTKNQSKSPTNLKKLRSFMGSVYHLENFIPRKNLSTQTIIEEK